MAADLQTGTYKRRNYENDSEKPVIAKTPTDLQRLRLEKLMKHPDKPVPIPERPKEKNTPHVPDFVRNVMGSSAGAGSGEFHVYRHLRRKEYARQKFIQEKAEKELHNEEYHHKLEENKRAAEERTAKKRAKRLKKKQRQKQIKKLKPLARVTKEHCSSGSGSDSGSEESGDEETIRSETKIQLVEEDDMNTQRNSEDVNNLQKDMKNVEDRNIEIETKGKGSPGGDTGSESDSE